MPVRCTRIIPLEHEFYFFPLCLLRSSTLSSLDVLKVFKGDIKRVARKVAIPTPADQS